MTKEKCLTVKLPVVIFDRLLEMAALYSSLDDWYVSLICQRYELVWPGLKKMPNKKDGGLERRCDLF